MHANFSFSVFKFHFSPQVLHVSIFKAGEVGHQTSQAFSFHWKLDIFPPGKDCLLLSSRMRYAEPSASLPMKHCFHLGHLYLGWSICKVAMWQDVLYLNEFLCGDNNPLLITHQYILSPVIHSFTPKNHRLSVYMCQALECRRIRNYFCPQGHISKNGGQHQMGYILALSLRRGTSVRTGNILEDFLEKGVLEKW